MMEFNKEVSHLYTGQPSQNVFLDRFYESLRSVRFPEGMLLIVLRM